MSNSDQQFDFILYGATSFVGQIMAEYLAGYTSEEYTWAMAGRSERQTARIRNNVLKI